MRAVYLKSLTLKGFKSFAEPTTIELEPGITVVVGPNGSGKSNIVDALAWVLGAQGPRVVRSARMDDVIFAGTQRRPALGRAEVSLIFDNSSRRLPIDLNEVEVTRTLFRSGESEYAINGAACRLLDVQELLSDTGVGRQQHLIIGQGQLDTVLSARPEDRRAIVEEAAGILKFRRRRERAERRLEASEGDLARLQDLLQEVRRQLRPLTRQAGEALRYDELAAERRALRLHLARAELGDLHERLSSGERRRAELDQETAITGADLARTWASLSLAEEEVAEPGDDRLAAVQVALESERDRARRLLALCRERGRAAASLVALLGDERRLSRLEAESAQVEEEIAQVGAELEALVPARREIERAEEELGLEEEAVGAAGPEGTLASDRRPSGLPRPAPGELERARRTAAEARSAEASARERRARALERAAGIEERRARLEARLAEHRAAAEGSEAAEAEALTECERLSGLASEAQSAASAAEERRRVTEGTLRGAEARVEALELALDEARAEAGLERLAGIPGVIGTLHDVVEVAEGAGLAFEAALEEVLTAVLVTGTENARAALERLRREGLDGSVLPVPPAPEAAGASSTDAPVSGGEAPRSGLRDLVRSGDPGVESLLDRLLGAVSYCRDGLDAAVELSLSDPARVVVTPGGDRFSSRGWRLGSGRSGATRAALAKAGQALESARAEAAGAAGAATILARSAEDARQAASSAARRLEGLRAGAARRSAEAAELQSELDALGVEQERWAAEAAAAGAELDRASVEVEAAERELERLERAERELADRLEAEAAARRALEARARELAGRRQALEVRSAKLAEREDALVARRADLAARIEAARAEQQRSGGQRRARAREQAVLSGLAGELETLLEQVDKEVARVVAARARRDEAARLREARLRALRSRREALLRVLTGLRERLQRLEVEQTEVRVRRETALEVIGRDLGLSEEELAEAPLPHLGAEADAAARLEVVEAELRRLGPVNALARQELAELEERSAFLEAQLSDVRAARRELGEVIGAVDHEIAEVFSSAYADVSRHFAQLFAALFPGGSGRLALTVPDDPLESGIEIEARPPGRSMRRLSLLSGGERSLVALAFLFAVFRSRPSPFYVMDEVEAALDDVNLRRFIGLLEEFRDEAQLIIVSHQKRTMEVADALYGVTLQPGGASKVVSERVRGGRAAAAGRTGGPQ